MLYAAVTEERCDEVESLVFDLFANLGATGARILETYLLYHIRSVAFSPAKEILFCHRGATGFSCSLRFC